MDKLWSLLPIAYTWVVTVKAGFNVRLLVIAIIVTFWGVRLTFNFARKGAYSIKFWTGVEDYRWVVLRLENQYQQGNILNINVIKKKYLNSFLIHLGDFKDENN